MDTLKIVNWITKEVLYEAAAESLKSLLVEAVKKKINLRGADLTGAHLRGADLTGAHLRGADLTGAYLRGAYLTGADLTGADLTGADLTGADLTGADLTKGQMKINWSSHNLIGEILWREAKENIDRQMLAAFISKKTDWCWAEWIKFQHPERKWAIQTLKGWITEGDDAPEFLTTTQETP